MKSIFPAMLSTVAVAPPEPGVSSLASARQTTDTGYLAGSRDSLLFPEKAAVSRVKVRVEPPLSQCAVPRTEDWGRDIGQQVGRFVEKSFRPEVQHNLYSQGYTYERDGVFLNTAGDNKYGVEMLTNEQNDLILPSQLASCPFNGCFYIRVGSLIITDQVFYNMLPTAVRQQMGSNVILVDGMPINQIGHLDTQSFKHYTVAAIIALMQVDLTGKRVVDCGAGDGPLALAALKLGASEVVLIESNPRDLLKARINLKLNGAVEGQHYRVIGRSLHATRDIVDLLPEDERDVVLVSNIGRWPLNYRNTTNVTSMHLIPLLDSRTYGRVTDLVLGGFSYDREHQPDQDILHAHQLGFDQPIVESSAHYNQRAVVLRR